jgi:acetyl-CoA C-acetyltransferase
VNPHTPVLVGVGTVTQRVDDARQAEEAIELVRRAVVAAADDAGTRALLGEIGLVLVPEGIWPYTDPGRLVTRAVGADTHTVLARVGVLQQTLVTRACAAVASGAVDAAVVCGGEAKFRDRTATSQGVKVPVTPDDGVPDETLAPDGDILLPVEIERDLATPAHQYAVMENALRHVDGLSDRAHRERLGKLWASFASVAADQPDAWDRSDPGPSVITTPTATNRMIATPYTRLLCSQWNVDQAAALLVTSVEMAERLGIDRGRWVFPVAAAESNAMTAMSVRAEPHRSPAVAHAGRAVLDHAGIDLDGVHHLDLYSCFPSAVQIQARELGLALDDARGLTVTGGMTFAGGPLNSYGLHATAGIARALRADSASYGLVTGVSGILTKSAVALWSSAPPERDFAAIDVSDTSRATTELRRRDADATGPGVIVGSTVVHDRGEPARGVAVVEIDGVRTVATSPDPQLAQAMTIDDWSGRVVDVPLPGVLAPR